jgi:hypothetical protein
MMWGSSFSDFAITTAYAAWLFSWVMGSVWRDARQQRRWEHVMPVRIQQRRTAGWRMPLNAKSVARPSKWGNPFKVVVPTGDMGDWGYDLSNETWQVVRANRKRGDGHYGRYSTEIEATRAAVEIYRSWLTGLRISGMGATGRMLKANLNELYGYDLACWCKLPPPGQPDVCHARVLLDLIEEASL